MKYQKIYIFTAIISTLFLTFLFINKYNSNSKNKPNTDQNKIEISNSPTPSPITSIINNLGIQNNQAVITKQKTIVPVLMYHYIREYNNLDDQIGINLSVSPAKFDQQMQWLKENNYQTVDFSEIETLKALPTGKQANNYKLIILTFDDGYLDAYTNTFSILKKYDFTATFYITTNFVGKDNYMTWQQIMELKNAGMNIGSHTLSHPDLAKTTDINIEKEVSQSQKILEEKLNTKITDFCYPSGKYDSRTINILKKYQFCSATTTNSGIYNSTINNLFEIPRLRIVNNSDLAKILISN